MRLSSISGKIKTISSQKENAKSILADLSSYFDYVLLAGGAPRNWAHGMEANDFDIYVCRKVFHDTEKQIEYDKKLTEKIDILGKKYGFDPSKKENKEVSSNAYGGRILHSLYSFEHENECQLIVIDDNNNQVNSLDSFAARIFMTFDFGICMTSMDKDGNMYNAPLFEEDYKNKTFTVSIKELKRNNEAGMRKLVERFHKMEKYFPKHKMRIR